MSDDHDEDTLFALYLAAVLNQVRFAAPDLAALCATAVDLRRRDEWPIGWTTQVEPSELGAGWVLLIQSPGQNADGLADGCVTKMGGGYEWWVWDGRGANEPAPLTAALAALTALTA